MICSRDQVVLYLCLKTFTDEFFFGRFPSFSFGKKFKRLILENFQVYMKTARKTRGIPRYIMHSFSLLQYFLMIQDSGSGRVPCLPLETTEVATVRESLSWEIICVTCMSCTSVCFQRQHRCCNIHTGTSAPMGHLSPLNRFSSLFPLLRG